VDSLWGTYIIIIIGVENAKHVLRTSRQWENQQLARVDPNLGSKNGRDFADFQAVAVPPWRPSAPI